MDDELKLLFQMAVRKYSDDRELLRQLWSQWPHDRFVQIMRKTMPPVAPCSEFALRMRHRAVSGSRQRQGPD